MKRLTKILSVLSLSLFTVFTSCQFGNSNKVTPKRAEIKFNIGGVVEENLSRAATTASTLELDDIDNEKLGFLLKVQNLKLDENDQVYYEEVVNEVYTGLTAVRNATFYLDFGTYNFSLVAYEDENSAKNPSGKDTVYECNLEYIEVSEYNKTVEFDMEYGTAKGSIEYKITFPNGSNAVLKATLGHVEEDAAGNIIFPLQGDTLVFSEEEADVGEREQWCKAEEDDEGKLIADYTFDSLSPGHYTLSLQLQYSTESNSVETLEFDLDIPVKPTLTTKKSFEFSNFNAIYAISYEEVDGIEENLHEDFKKYHKVELPDLSGNNEALHKTFLGWSYKLDGEETYTDITATTANDVTKYILNDAYDFATDVTVKANWEDWGEPEVTLVDINDFTLTASNTDYELDDAANYSFSVTGNVTTMSNVTYKWILNGVTLKNQTSKNILINTAKTTNAIVGENTLTVIVSGGGLSASKSIKFTVVDPVVYGSAISYPASLGSFEIDDVYLNEYEEYCSDAAGNYYFAITKEKEVEVGTAYEYKSVLSCVKCVPNRDGTYTTEPTEIASKVVDDENFYPVRMVSDGSYIYIIGKTANVYNTDRKDYCKYSGNTIYYVSTDAEGDEFKTVTIETNPFKVITAITFDSGKAYVAGDVTGDTTVSGEHSYSVYSFDINPESDENNVKFTNGIEIIKYTDDNYFSTSTINTLVKTSGFIPTEYEEFNTGKEIDLGPLSVYVVSYITDLGILKGNIYALGSTISLTKIKYYTYYDEENNEGVTNDNDVNFVTVESRVLSKALGDTSDASTFSKIDLISNPTYRKFYSGNGHKAYGSFYANEEYDDTGDGNQWLIAPLRFIAIKPKKITMANTATNSDCIELDLINESVSVRIGKGSFKKDQLVNSCSGITTNDAVGFHQYSTQSVYFNY